ncbi:MAG: toll/interleukin-1 receptor domain-containing protein [Clostridia bacterium]|nr:toll/interleukin-1 receptor domain-containing protein [Clostridia bacterium]
MAEYYSREEIIKSDFLFVSYKHDDRDLVISTVDYLISLGVRVWCDIDLRMGDKWDEEVKELIEHSKCKGVIFFNSVQAFMSEAIAKERDLVRKKIKASEEENNTFLVLPVNIGKPSTARLLKKTFEVLEDDDSDINRNFPLEYINDIIELFKSETIYAYADDSTVEKIGQDIYKSIEMLAPKAIDKSKVKLKELTHQTSRTVGDMPCIRFGEYKGAAVKNLPQYMLSKDSVVEYFGERYIVDGGKAYTPVGINWQCIYCDGDETCMVSEEILDSRIGGTDLDNWLNTQFIQFAFSEKERECIIGKVSLVGEKDIEAAESKEFLKATCSENTNEKYWWINAFSMGVMQKVVREDGTIYGKGYNSRTTRSGVRPMIKVDMNKLSNLSK